MPSSSGAHEREYTETFWDSYPLAFTFFGSCARRITYYNRRVMVAKTIGPRRRGLTEGFLQLEGTTLTRLVVAGPRAARPSAWPFGANRS